MHPAFDLYFFEMPVYTALVMLGAVIGVLTAYLYLRVRRVGQRRKILDLALVVFAAAWIGARAYHVALNREYYAARPDEIAQFGLGGLAMRGAFIAGFAALAIYSAARHASFWHLADAGALGLTSGQAIGWMGALAHGANYGVVSESRLAQDLPDLYGLIQPRFPLQHAEIVLFVGLFVGLLVVATRQPRAGALFLVYLLIASAANCALGFQRGDETVFVGALRLDQMADATFAALALVGLARRLIIALPGKTRNAY
jgi:prolipoprotein diacylglyceryl transferase